MLLRLLAAAVAAGLLVGTGGAVVQQSSARDTLRAEISDQDRALASELAARLDEEVRAQSELLSIIGTRQPVATLSPSADEELRAVLGESTTFDELVLFDESGRPLAAAANSSLVRAADYEPRPGRLDSTIITVLDSFPPTMEILTPVEHPPGTQAGKLLGRVPLELLTVLALRVDREGTIRSVVDSSGTILVHPERDRVLAGEQMPLRDVLAQEDQVLRIEEEDGPHLLAAARTQLFPGAVVLDQPEAAVLAPLDDQLRELTAILVLVVLAMVLAVIVAGTYLLAPLRPLRVAVSRLGRRERGVRVEERSPGEVGELADEFNRLAAALDDRQEEVAELQRLSLLVNSRTSVEAVADEVVRGVARLLPADRAAFCTGGDAERPPEVLASHGPVKEGAKIERATIAMRIRRPHIDTDGIDHFAALPISTIDGDVVGALVASRHDAPFDDHEIALAEAYAAFAGVAVDNAQRLALEQDLAAELQQAVDQRRGLLSTLSHEFRTPLTCIDGFSASLLEDWDAFDDAHRKQLVGKIQHHGAELSDLVNRLLDFAVTERGKLAAALRPVRLDEEIEMVRTGMEPLLVDREVRVDVPEVEVTADPTLLRRAVSNLVSNAVKYSPPDAPITIQAVPSDRTIRLEVIDQGQGLSADEAARAFQPFWRAGDPATRVARGTGLGLALVAQYAKAMGGSAGVVSEPGHGSTFFIVLERGRALPDRENRYSPADV